jgi:uncharacterized protein
LQFNADNLHKEAIGDPKERSREDLITGYPHRDQRRYAVLIEFSVANFRSFADEQTLSMSAGRFRSKRIGAVLDTSSKTAPHLLRAVGIMGANGSGKSSLVLALQFMQRFVTNSAQSMQHGDRIPTTPFKLDEDLRTSPSTFSVTFLHEEVEYHYSFSVSQTEVVCERLLSRFKHSSWREVFSRTRESGDEIWNLSGLPKAQAKLWRQSTRDNALFLSTAVQLNSNELTKPYEWLTECLRIQSSEFIFSNYLISHMIKDHAEDGCKSAILDLLRESDLGIRDVRVTEENFNEEELPEDMPEELRHAIISEMKDKTFFSTQFEHRSRQFKNVLFDFDEVSDGTRRIYALAGPIIATLRHDMTLVIDEIEDSLHPYIVRLIIQMFQNPEPATSSAQLIFTTHSDGLLDSGLLERDQFWFAEKRRGSTELIALHDYRPRKGEALRQNYLRGRYGGVPAIAKVERP